MTKLQFMCLLFLLKKLFFLGMSAKTASFSDELEVKLEDDNDTSAENLSDLGRNEDDYESYDEIESCSSDNEADLTVKTEDESSSSSDEDDDDDDEEEDDMKKGISKKIQIKDKSDDIFNDTKNVVKVFLFYFYIKILKKTFIGRNLINQKIFLQKEKKKIQKLSKRENKLKSKERVASEKIAYIKPSVEHGYQRERKLLRQATK